MTGSDWVAVAGIVGTLAGAGLGAFVTWKLQRDSVAHEDRTRFHALRLELYARFTSNANLIVAQYKSGGTVNLAANEAVIRDFETIQLVSSGPVNVAAGLVHRFLLGVITAAASGGPSKTSVEDQHFNKLMAQLKAGMREEIGG